jgi:hypothetical protein
VRDTSLFTFLEIGLNYEFSLTIAVPFSILIARRERADEWYSATPIYDLRTEIGRPHGRILWGKGRED